jgi:hypothetical protein
VPAAAGWINPARQAMMRHALREAVVTTWLCTGGSRLATPRGPMPVEALASGDEVLGRDGGVLAVRWVGRLHLPAPALAAQPALWPVLGPQGAMLPGQVVERNGFPPVAARWLVDGQVLSRPAPVAALEVFSLELDGEEMPDGAGVVAEGAVEPALPAERVLLALRQSLAGAPAGAMVGRLDEVSRAVVSGWVEGGGPVAVELVVDGVPQPPVMADGYRADLEAAGVGDGRRGFRLVLDPPLDPRRRHLVRVRRALDGMDLPGSPALLDAAAGLGAVLDAAETDTLREMVRAVAARI